MAEAKAKTEKVTKQEDCPVIGNDRMVEYRVPRVPGEKDQPDIIASVNGKSYQLKRGTVVNIPYDLYLILKQSDESVQKAEAYYFGHVMQ